MKIMYLSLTVRVSILRHVFVTVSCGDEICFLKSGIKNTFSSYGMKLPISIKEVMVHKLICSLWLLWKIYDRQPHVFVYFIDRCTCTKFNSFQNINFDLIFLTSLLMKMEKIKLGGQRSKYQYQRLINQNHLLRTVSNRLLCPEWSTHKDYKREKTQNRK